MHRALASCQHIMSRALLEQTEVQREIDHVQNHSQQELRHVEVPCLQTYPAFTCTQSCVITDLPHASSAVCNATLSSILHHRTLHSNPSCRVSLGLCYITVHSYGIMYLQRSVEAEKNALSQATAKKEAIKKRQGSDTAQMPCFVCLQRPGHAYND